PMVASGGAAVILLGASRVFLIGDMLLARVLASATIYGVAYVALWWGLPKGREVTRELVQLARER
ncbi:MAG: hypothetical protein ACM359_24295, partial [Bacillota bacterium]